jgi:cytochrome c553
MAYPQLFDRQGPINAYAACAARLSWALLVMALALYSTAVVRAQPTDHAPDTMEARLLACAACHGRQGQGTNNDYFPPPFGR